jgi:hypothetical protein
MRFSRHTSVDRPNSRRGELEEILVGIAEIETLAAGRPIDFAFDRDALSDEVAFPGWKILFRNGKGKVGLSRAVVRGDEAAGHLNGLNRSSEQEDQQHLMVSGGKGAQAIQGFEKAQAKPIPVEAYGAWQFGRIDAGLNDALNMRERHVRLEPLFDQARDGEAGRCVLIPRFDHALHVFGEDVALDVYGVAYLE